MATQIIFQKNGNSYIFWQFGHFLRWLERLYFEKLDIHILENWTFSKVASWLVWCFPSILLRTQTIFTFAKSGKLSFLKQVHFGDKYPFTVPHWNCLDSIYRDVRCIWDLIKNRPHSLCLCLCLKIGPDFPFISLKPFQNSHFWLVFSTFGHLDTKQRNSSPENRIFSKLALISTSSEARRERGGEGTCSIKEIGPNFMQIMGKYWENIRREQREPILKLAHILWFQVLTLELGQGLIWHFLWINKQKRTILATFEKFGIFATF